MKDSCVDEFYAVVENVRDIYEGTAHPIEKVGETI